VCELPAHSIDSVVAGRGILSSAIATGVLGFVTCILFLFCTPDLDTVFALDAPQPFVQIYALALGKGPSIFMTVVAVLGLIMVRLVSRCLSAISSNVIIRCRTQALLSSRPLVWSSPWPATAFFRSRTGSGALRATASPATPLPSSSYSQPRFCVPSFQVRWLSLRLYPPAVYPRLQHTG